jgi:hypothetical protein
MSFNDVGPVTYLAPGKATRWWYRRPNGDDFGFQHAAADVKTPNAGGEHVAYDQTKAKYSNGGATYWVTIKNNGPGGAWHNLQGGGAV